VELLFPEVLKKNGRYCSEGRGLEESQAWIVGWTG